MSKLIKSDRNFSEVGKVLFEKYMNDGTMWIEDGEYVGRASDGQIISFGSVLPPPLSNEAIITQYLEAKPTPDLW